MVDGQFVWDLIRPAELCQGVGDDEKQCCQHAHDRIEGGFGQIGQARGKECRGEDTGLLRENSRTDDATDLPLILNGNCEGTTGVRSRRV